MNGARQIAERVVRLRSAFPDFKLEFTRILCDGDHFVHWWTSTGTHRGEFMGVPATGRHVETRGISVGRTENGRIVEEELYYDRLAFVEGIGVQPANASMEMTAANA
jgi:steroid delta-isomerase-like uncharacterized protein